MVVWLSFSVKNNKVKIGKKWFRVIKKLNPYDYLDANAIKIIEQVKTDLLPTDMFKSGTGEHDCFSLIEGKVGSGKSNFANLFNLAIDPTYSADRCIYRDWHYWRIKNRLTKNIHKDIDVCRGKAISFDELRRVLHAKDSLQSEAKAVEKDLGDIRTLGFNITACIDDVKSIMRYVRDTRIDLWFYCRKRGEIWVYKLYTTHRDTSRAERKINYLKKKLLQGEHPHTPYKIYCKAIPKNSLFWIKFKRREITYKAAAKEGKENIKRVKLDEKVQRLLRDTLTATQAAKVLHIGKTTLLNWEKRKKLLPILTYKGKRYKMSDISKIIDGRM